MPPKHKKHMKLPNGYGNISYLGTGRRRPYAVYPPVEAFDEDGRPIRKKAIGYAETYQDGMELLVAWHNGIELPGRHFQKSSDPTFSAVYKKFYSDKFDNPAKKLSKSVAAATKMSYDHLEILHDRVFKDIRYDDLQSAVDAIQLKRGSVEKVVSMIKQLYQYAEKYELVDKDPSRHLTVRMADDTVSGTRITDEELELIWQHSGDLEAQIILILSYSGYRIGALRGLEIHAAPDWYFKGGVKTAAGKGRIVPIHTCIQGFIPPVEASGVIRMSDTYIRRKLEGYWSSLGMDHHPHDCRHTFSALCEKYGVPEADRKRMMGHSFGSDITNSVYGHRTIDELRASIELIRPPEGHVANAL